MAVYVNGLGQLLETVFKWSLAIVRFMMNKSIIDQKREVKKVVRFYLYKLSSKELTKCIIYKLKRLSSSLFNCRTQNNRFKGGFAAVSFPSN